MGIEPTFAAREAAFTHDLPSPSWFVSREQGKMQAIMHFRREKRKIGPVCPFRLSLTAAQKCVT